MDDWVAWILANPEGAAALASAVTAVAMLGLVAVGLLIGGGQIAVIWWGFRRLEQSEEALEREREYRHRERIARMDDERREAARRHEDSTQASHTLIQRTAPPAPVE